MIPSSSQIHQQKDFFFFSENQLPSQSQEKFAEAVVEQPEMLRSLHHDAGIEPSLPSERPEVNLHSREKLENDRSHQFRNTVLVLTSSHSWE